MASSACTLELVGVASGKIVSRVPYPPFSQTLPTPLISIGFQCYQLTKTGWPKQLQVIQGIATTWVDVMGRTLKSSKYRIKPRLERHFECCLPCQFAPFRGICHAFQFTFTLFFFLLLLPHHQSQQETLNCVCRCVCAHYKLLTTCPHAIMTRPHALRSITTHPHTLKSITTRPHAFHDTPTHAHTHHDMPITTHPHQSRHTHSIKISHDTPTRVKVNHDTPIHIKNTSPHRDTRSDPS